MDQLSKDLSTTIRAVHDIATNVLRLSEATRELAMTVHHIEQHLLAFQNENLSKRVHALENHQVKGVECCYEGCKRASCHYGYFNFMWREACMDHMDQCLGPCCYQRIFELKREGAE